jgi:hypothetical protein
MIDIKGRIVPTNYVQFFAFAASEFEYEELFYIAARIAKAENRTHDEAEAELSNTLRFVENNSKPNHPYETWGPQELADRINSYKDVEI